jgi:endoglucanase
VAVTPSALQSLAQRQVDYILGSNAKGMSYMVGYGGSFPRHVHHRDASIPSSANALGTGAAACSAGFQYYHAGGPDPNVLTGAVVGGPDANDAFADDRGNYAQSEPATYINAPLVGMLAFLSSHVQRPSTVALYLHGVIHQGKL